MTTVRSYKQLRGFCAALALLAGVHGLLAQTSQAAPAGVSSLVTSNSQFAVDLYKQINSTAGADNIFLSPYSVSTALAMTYAGSRSTTQKQMAGALHFNPSDASVLDEFSTLLGQTKAAAGKDYKLDIANALWGERSEQFDPAYVGTVQKYFGGGFNAVDFIHDADGSRQKINQSVADSTEGKIQNLLGPGDFDKDTRLVLTSAIYFKGNWSSPFRPEDTQDAPFTLSNGSKVTVPLMEQVGDFWFVKQTGLTAINLPYADNDLAMVAILPDRDINELAKSLSSEKIEQLRKGMRRVKVDVYLPRFEFQSQYHMAQMLAQMGMPDAFDPKRADFSGMDGKTDLYIGQVIHQAMIEVNEEGSVAAAATATTMFAATAMPGPPETIELFRADRPFLFLIVHNATGAILFLGRMSSPASVSASAPKSK